MKKFLKCLLVTVISLSVICPVNPICRQNVSAEETAINWVRGVPYDANGYRIIMSGDEISLIATTASSDTWLSGGWNSTNNNVANVTYSKYYACIVKGGSAGTCIIKYDGSTMYYLPDALTGKLLPMVNPQHEEFRIRVVSVNTISLNKTSLSVELNGSAKLSYTLSPADDYTTALTTVTYSSSDTSVATVDDNGNVKGIKAGTATITAKTGNGKMATCKVTVTSASTSKTAASNAPSKVKLNKTKLSLKKGASKKLKYSFTPSDAKSTVTWSSSNKKVAKVSSSGKVTATGYGSAVITVKTSNGKTATCKVTVPAPKVKKIKLNKTKLELMVGKKTTLKYTLSPKGAKTKVSFKSSKTSVATVNSKGKITAKKAGKTTITVKTSNGKKATCKVTVKAPAIKKIKLSKSSLNLEVGNKYQMAYTLSPKNASGAIKWKSSKTSVATVNSKGVITAKKAGTAKITAYKGKIKAVCTVTVKKKASKGNSSQKNAANTNSSASNTSANSGNENSGSGNSGDTTSNNSNNSSGETEGGTSSEYNPGETNIFDLSKGTIKVRPDMGTVEQSDFTYTCDLDNITIMQSGADAGYNSGDIWIWNQNSDLASEPVHIILAGINMQEKDISINSRNTVTLEAKSGTENTCRSIKSYQSSPNTLYLTGDGIFNINNSSMPAIYVSDALVIQASSLYVSTEASDKPVIGSYIGDCKNITIESGAHVYASGGCKAVGTSLSSGTEENINISDGTLIYEQ